MPSLAIAVFKQLRIVYHRFFEANYLSLTPFSKIDLVISPYVVDEPYAASSLEIILNKARALDAKGTRSQWNIKGGPEREQATQHYDMAVRIAVMIYEKGSLQYAEVALEFAKHLESIHEESGSPLNSKWNRSAQILPSNSSELSQFFYDDALKVFESHNNCYKQMIECLLGLGKLCAVVDVTTI